MRLVPYVHPHDHPNAGLRDYRPQPPRPRRRRALLLSGAGVVVAWVLLWLATGCASRPFVPDRPHPTAADIAALAQIATPTQAFSIADVTLRVYPALVMAGAAVRVTCLVPRRPEYRAISFGLADVRASGRQVDALAYELLVEQVPCGTWQAYCAVFGAGGRVVARRQQSLTSRGSCNDDDSGDLSTKGPSR